MDNFANVPSLPAGLDALLADVPFPDALAPLLVLLLLAHRTKVLHDVRLRGHVRRAAVAVGPAAILGLREARIVYRMYKLRCTQCPQIYSTEFIGDPATLLLKNLFVKSFSVRASSAWLPSLRPHSEPCIDTYSCQLLKI